MIQKLKGQLQKIWEYGLPKQYSKREYKQLVLGNQVLFIFLIAAVFMELFTAYFCYTIYFHDAWYGVLSLEQQRYSDYFLYYSIPSLGIIFVLIALFLLRPLAHNDQLIAFVLIFFGVIFVGSITVMLGGAISFQLIALMFIPPSLFFVKTTAFAVSQTLFIAISYTFLEVFLGEKPGLFPLPEEVVPYALFFIITNSAGILATCSFYLWYETEKTETGLEKAQMETANSLAKVKTLLSEVQALKDKQDADYYLISILIEPLLARTASSLGPMQAESYLKQKKDFEFRNGRWEIGGDINICDKIRLQNRDYLVLANADAMGKSIQGAGGSLVFGTVFHSIISRTKTRPIEQDCEPKQWIANAMEELQTVFESFAGAMSLSLVIVLVDEMGRLYYVNIGHPYLVLFRDAQASFLEKSMHMHRLGYELNDHEIEVKEYSLSPGESVLFGSDGRDDIVLPDTQSINDDFNYFLSFVETVGPHPKRIYQEIAKTSKFTDDFSLVSLRFIQ